MLLEACAQLLQTLPMQIVFKYITNFKNMPNHILPKHARSIGCKVQKTKGKFLSSSWVVDIMKWLKKWGVDDLLEP